MLWSALHRWQPHVPLGPSPPGSSSCWSPASGFPSFWAHVQAQPCTPCHRSSSPALPAPPPCRHTAFTDPVFSLLEHTETFVRPTCYFLWRWKQLCPAVHLLPGVPQAMVWAILAWTRHTQASKDRTGREHHSAPHKSTMVLTRSCRKRVEKAGIHTLIQLSYPEAYPSSAS